MTSESENRDDDWTIPDEPDEKPARRPAKKSAKKPAEQAADKPAAPARRRRRRRSRGDEPRPAPAEATVQPRTADASETVDGPDTVGEPDTARTPEAVDKPRAAPPLKTEFQKFGLPLGLLRGLDALEYHEPTEIQAEMIPLALSGHNIVARSRTGTGKTCAFLVPALTALEEVGEDGRQDPQGPPRILVVEPTRELAIQVAEENERITRFLPVRTSCVYGGTRLQGQFKSIPQSAVVVGTPGRLLDHLGRRTFDGREIRILVLDEVDRMYDLGFRDDVDRILRYCSERKQTLLVSATLNEDVEALVARHLPEYEKIEIESRSLTVDEVQQRFYVVPHDRKRELLMALIRERKPGRAIIFTRTRFTADRVAYVLQQEGFDAQEIHSGLPQRRREQILQAFRDGKLSLLVATDVAARGLDIQGVDHVVNYDIPQAAEDYVHRVGRTARMGHEGWAVTLVTPDDGPYLTSVEKLINKEIQQERFPGFELPPSQSERRSGDDAKDAAADGQEEEEPSRGIPNWNRPARKRHR